MGRIHIRTALATLIALAAIEAGLPLRQHERRVIQSAQAPWSSRRTWPTRMQPRRARDRAHVVGKDLDQQSRDRRCDDDPGGRPEDDAHLHGAGRRLQHDGRRRRVAATRRPGI